MQTAASCCRSEVCRLCRLSPPTTTALWPLSAAAPPPPPRRSLANYSLLVLQHIVIGGDCRL